MCREQRIVYRSVVQHAVQGDEGKSHVSVGAIHLIECLPVWSPHKWIGVRAGDSASALVLVDFDNSIASNIGNLR
jgi:hypothetical protein